MLGAWEETVAWSGGVWLVNFCIFYGGDSDSDSVSFVPGVFSLCCVIFFWPPEILFGLTCSGESLGLDLGLGLSLGFSSEVNAISADVRSSCCVLHTAYSVVSAACCVLRTSCWVLREQRLRQQAGRSQLSCLVLILTVNEQ